MNRDRFHSLLCAAAVVALFAPRAHDALAQTCVQQAPSKPPLPDQLIVQLPADGGTQGCTASAHVSGGATPQPYPIGNAKCATAVGIAQQAAANDNGWNDGGTP